jgi:hypothetical protein
MSAPAVTSGYFILLFLTPESKMQPLPLVGGEFWFFFNTAVDFLIQRSITFNWTSTKTNPWQSELFPSSDF